MKSPTKLSFKEAVARAAAATGESPDRSNSLSLNLILLAVAPIQRPVDVIRLLAANGVSLKKARMVLDRLAARALTPVQIKPERANELLAALYDLNVVGSVLETPPVDAKAIRESQGLSQPDFASLYGIEVDTLKNWEQGRNAPDGAARLLLGLIEENPTAVIHARAKSARGIILEALSHAQSAGTAVRVTYSTEPAKQNFAWIIKQRAATAD